jgi:hypothetical protein
MSYLGEQVSSAASLELGIEEAKSSLPYYFHATVDLHTT